MSKLITLAIDRRRNESVIDQIRQDIKERMLDKTFIQHEYLPSPKALALANQLTEQEVLKAYQSLMKEGYISDDEQGYKVARFSIEEKTINAVQSVSQMLRNEGFTPSSEVLERTQVDVFHHPELAHFFGFSEPLLYVRVLYSGDDRPLLHVETYLSLKDYPELQEVANLTPFITQNLKSTQRQIDVVKVPLDVAHTLNLDPADAVMRVRNVYYGAHQKILTVSFVHATPNYSLLLDQH